MLTVYLVEDEPLAMECLKLMFKKFPEWEVIGCADNGAKALQDCLENPPNLLMTDIKMPVLNGLELVTELNKSNHLIEVIFITAFEQHALTAFKLAAIGYLLKPISQKDFKNCIHKVMNLIQNHKSSERMKEIGISLDELIRYKKSYLQTIVIRSIGRVEFIQTSDVIAFCGSRNYIEVITENKIYLHRMTLKCLYEELDHNSFIRIHRSTIVSLKAIKLIKRSKLSDIVVLTNNAKFVIGAKYMQKLRKKIRL